MLRRMAARLVRLTHRAAVLLLLLLLLMLLLVVRPNIRFDESRFERER
jgi:hypothetical protein